MDDLDLMLLSSLFCWLSELIQLLKIYFDSTTIVVNFRLHLIEDLTTKKRRKKFLNNDGIIISKFNDSNFQGLSIKSSSFRRKNIFLLSSFFLSFFLYFIFLLLLFIFSSLFHSIFVFLFFSLFAFSVSLSISYTLPKNCKFLVSAYFCPSLFSLSVFVAVRLQNIFTKLEYLFSIENLSL